MFFCTGMYSCIAGFMDPGEPLEECVRREVAEEVPCVKKFIKNSQSISGYFPKTSTNRSFIGKRSNSIVNKQQYDEMMRHGSVYDTPFILDKEPGNKFKVRDEVKQTMNLASEIPFLRS